MQSGSIAAGLRRQLPQRFILLAVLLGGAVLTVWLNDVHRDRQHELDVLAPIQLLEIPPQRYPESNRVVATVSPGELVQVRRMGYGKDFRAWKVRTRSGIEGWFIDDEKNARVRNK